MINFINYFTPSSFTIDKIFHWKKRRIWSQIFFIFLRDGQQITNPNARF